MYTGEHHTFAVCAYQESPYLEECIRSLKQQTAKSRIILTTSTPNAFIRALAEKYELPVYINTGIKGIAGDWNFALEQCSTELVTLAHQDDIYCPRYLEQILTDLNRSRYPLIAFTDYGEQREEGTVYENRLLRIKRLMLFPLKFSLLWPSRFVRRRILSLGSAICCPSVTLVKEHLQTPVFRPGMRSNIDWEAWEQISREKGSFVYCDKVLMLHRIHAASTTTDIINGGERRKEDMVMFRKFWPVWICRVLSYFYSKSEESNSK